MLVCWIPFHKQKMSAAASEEIVNNRGKVSSPVWQFLGYYKSDRSQTNVVCKLCKTVVPAKTGNTTNLMYHLSRAHSLEHSCIQPTTSVAAAPHKQQTAWRGTASVPYDKESKGSGTSYSQRHASAPLRSLLSVHCDFRLMFTI